MPNDRVPYLFGLVPSRESSSCKYSLVAICSCVGHFHLHSKLVFALPDSLLESMGPYFQEMMRSTSWSGFPAEMVAAMKAVSCLASKLDLGSSLKALQEHILLSDRDRLVEKHARMVKTFTGETTWVCPDHTLFPWRERAASSNTNGNERKVHLQAASPFDPSVCHRLHVFWAVFTDGVLLFVVCAQTAQCAAHESSDSKPSQIPVTGHKTIPEVKSERAH